MKYAKLTSFLTSSRAEFHLCPSLRARRRFLEGCVADHRRIDLSGSTFFLPFVWLVLLLSIFFYIVNCTRSPTWTQTRTSHRIEVTTCIIAIKRQTYVNLALDFEKKNFLIWKYSLFKTCLRGNFEYFILSSPPPEGYNREQTLLNRIAFGRFLYLQVGC